MNEPDRPDPDALLAAIEKQSASESRGKLKIFFGMVAGVGKTYAMLEAARQRKSEGVDVVIGYVETHGRVETEALLTDLSIMQRKKIEYRGTQREEMDIDGILTRKPQLVLVDELAHTNIPGSRHEKRYQDVLELIEAGIDVYTTVNVQHFESRADAVQQITGTVVRETLPDSLLDLADDVELIDITPDELLKRLAEGKVYTPDRAELAAKNFFRRGNLTALREMSLRLTAERVDHQLRDYMSVKQISGPWKSGDRLMVAVSSSPLSERLVRWTRRMAYTMEAPWIAVSVETSQLLTPQQKAQLARNLELVRELGGEPLSIPGEDVPATLLKVAHQQNISQIVVGKPFHGTLKSLFSGRTMVDKLIKISGNIDVYVVTGDERESQSKLVLAPPQRYSTLNQYLWAVLIVIVTVAINKALTPILSYQAVGLLLVLMVLMLAITFGRGPVLLAAALSSVLWDFLFIPPLYTFTISKIEDAVMVALYFMVAIVTGNLTAQIRRQQRILQQREERTHALYVLAREVASDVTIDDVLQTAVTQIKSLFDADVIIVLRDVAGHLAEQPHGSSTFSLVEHERGVAIWAYENHKKAGRFTDTLTMASAEYLPLLTPGGVFGVVGIKHTERLLPDQVTFLDTVVSQIALAVERTMLDEAAKRTVVLEESERLYNTLLNSISHELRTPLATISGATSGLLNEQIAGNPEARKSLGQDIQDATDRLNRLVGNLLDMTRLESGQLRLNRQWCDVNDLINISIGRVEAQLSKHVLIVELAPSLPLIYIDFGLMEQALVNLLHNATLYTPAGTRIRVQTWIEESELVIMVADRGPGLPDTERVFEKFWRAPKSITGGTGLGLSISRGFVEAHGGILTAENRANGGARFTIRLPLVPEPEMPQEATQ
jgi:two-component system sensor histidine kinase KdpD